MATITPADIAAGAAWPAGSFEVSRSSDWPFTFAMSTWTITRSLESFPTSYAAGITTSTLPRAMSAPAIGGGGSSSRTTGQIWPL